MKIHTRFFITFFCFALFFAISSYLAQDSLFKHNQAKEDTNISNQIKYIKKSIETNEDEYALNRYLSDNNIGLERITYNTHNKVITHYGYNENHREISQPIITDYKLDNDIARTCSFINKSSDQVRRENPRNSEGDFIIQSFCSDDSIYIATSHYFQYQAAIKLLQKSYLFILLATAVISAILSYILARYISTPIANISFVTKKLSNLDFSSRVEVTGNDEIGELATNINILSDKLQHSIQKLKDNIIIEKESKEKQNQLFASMSHELKTPITILKGTLEGIKDQIGPYKEPLNFVDDMLEETNNMENIVMNLLSYAKFSVQDIKLNFQPYKISDLINMNLDRLDYIITENNLTIEKRLSDDYVEVDLASINMVFKNVLENAIYYSDKNAKIEVFVSTFSDHVLVQVFNHGSNIPGETILHMFEPFYRADDSRVKYKNGTGLGLTIVKQILEQHNSNFSLYNVNNDDEYAVCFEFTLKIAKDDKKIK
ncbi:MAG: HAMP domain-containing sensor histidine kinase [Erysipelotrichales bacterium]